MTFQRAPPEVNGFGVTTWTPDLRRSLHVRMCFGFPLRTTKTTTERVTMPWYLFRSQLGETRCAWTRVVMSGGSESSTTSAGSPCTTARACSPEAPYDWLNVTPFPPDVFWKAGMIFA